MGNTQPGFLAHASVLSRSPVLERMCDGPFQESITREIHLPEDDASDFSIVLEYLYTGNLQTIDMEDSCIGADQLASIYILADRYDLPFLKELIVRELSVHFSGIDSDVSCKHAIEFVRIAHKIYHGTAESQSNAVFYKYFEKTVMLALGVLEDDDLVAAQEMLADGGIFAIHLFQYQLNKMLKDKAKIRTLQDTEEKCRVAQTDLQKVTTELASLRWEHRELKSECNQARSKFEQSKSHHEAAHSDCRCRLFR